MTSVDLRSLNREELMALVDQVTWYHVIDLGDGVVTKGTFDLRPVLHEYGFPDDLRGKRVLDIGRSSGYFSFELERRGADVTATELPFVVDKDYVGGDVVPRIIRAREWGGRLPNADPEYGDRMDFALAHLILESRVKPLSLRLDELTLEAVGGEPFDLVFVGSLLNHVSDPISSLKRVAAVTGDLCIVVNPVDPEDESPVPSARLVGRGAKGLTSWWVPNVACLEEMMYCAGFDEVKVTNPALELPMPGSGATLRHAVVHARTAQDRTIAEARWAQWLDAGLSRPAPAQAMSARERLLAYTLARVEADSGERLKLIRKQQAEIERLNAELRTLAGHQPDAAE